MKGKEQLIRNEIHVIPAAPGFYPIYDDGNEIFIGNNEMILAWKIISTDQYDGSTMWPITADGSCAHNCIGVINPDKSVFIFNMCGYESFE